MRDNVSTCRVSSDSLECLECDATLVLSIYTRTLEDPASRLLKRI